MAAAMIPLLTTAGKKGGETATAALKNDIATLKGVTKPRGKGKKKKGGGLEYEVHINPMSIATSAAVVGGVAVGGLWLSGMSVSRQTGSAKTVTVRNDGTADKPLWRVYSAKGIPYKTLGSGFVPEDVLMNGQAGRGWKVAPNGVIKVSDSVYTIGLINDIKRNFTIGKRPRFSIFGSSTDSGTESVDYLEAVSPLYYWLKRL